MQTKGSREYRHLALWAVLSAVCLAVLVAGGCGSEAEPSSTPRDTTPPLLNELRSSGPSDDESLLEDLALNLDDLPSGFALEHEDTSDSAAGNASVYSARYFNESAPEDDLLAGRVPATIDVSMFLFNTDAEAEAYFAELQAKTTSDWVESVAGGGHLPADPDFTPLDADARLLDSPLGGTGFAVEISERIKYLPTDEITTFYNVSIISSVNRVIAIVDYGSLNSPISTDGMVEVAQAFERRIEDVLGQGAQ